ncbi:arabinogalactan oligomer/maltooligosaccharide transport system substrate-binding protein [Microbacterium keratanolyticum]|uniref:Sugar ABC transporter substrate-binding protein n=1 Tax=Microbacterium keratanolyticum TaxID=67574 RepID=A0A9W6HP83_9MICO|nr:maltose ABC transporter substrate-binding protein [Microbacterium keratanolyticum]MBM7468223.1 arabinogalactan oligomer/maltooligosaccharide transport system substrate-binding protein [Microbacterium keratanolyticum]GLK00298.1 sugar ABC transporter substrate-binding protein [Microbacterium keratanolyticum]
MKVNKKGVLGISALIATSALILTGCAGGGGDAGSTAPADGGSLTVWVDADRATVLKDAAKAFQDETGVKVTLVQKDFGEIRDQFISQVPTGKGPDIAVGAHDWLGTLVTNGVVAPVELGDAAGDFQKVAIDAMSYEGKTYGVPYSIENIALMRNTALAPEAPATYDDMIAAGTAAGTEYKFLVGLDPEQGDPYHLYPFQTSFGAPVFGTNADGTYNAADLQIGNAGGDAFAGWLAAQGAAGILNTNISGDLARESFVAGKSPFFLTGPWNVPAAQDAGLDIAIDPIPSAGGQPAQPFVGVQGFFLSAKSKNVVAATNFLTNYIGSEDVQTALFEVGGRAPALTASFDAALASDEIVEGFGTVGADAVPMPNIPQMGSVWEFWGVTEVAIINAQGDPVTLWQKMTSDIAAAIK